MNTGPSIDPTRPCIARVYDYLLGSKDNYATDRAVGDVFKRDLPGSVDVAFANRAALARAVREITKTTGVRQSRSIRRPSRNQPLLA